MIVKCTERDLVEYLGRQIPKLYGEENCNVTKQYIFAKGTLPVILLAHMDTVFYSPPETILYDREQELITSPEGIGGDDRNGVYSILKIITNRKDNLPYVLFTTSEERGCKGARAASEPLKDKVKDVLFAIQIDRAGKDDAVFYSCQNKEFKEYICSFGYKDVKGLHTDICVLCPEWGFAGVNFSSGYVGNHKNTEIVNVGDMFATIQMVNKILDDVAGKKDMARFSYTVPTSKKSVQETKAENIAKGR